MSAAAEPTTLSRTSVIDELVGALRSRILAGGLPPGAPLREERLAASYGVSRHTLRAALRTLAAEGLIQIVANRGAYVAQLEAEDLAPLFELRTALELEACHLALERNDGILPSSVHDCLDVLVRASRAKESDWSDVAAAHARFHEALVGAAQSPRIADAYARLATELNLFLAQLRPVWSRRRMIDHHRTLVHALESTGDVAALRRHLDEGRDAILETPVREQAAGAPRG